LTFMHRSALVSLADRCIPFVAEEIHMCRRVTCPNCNKPTWAGCGEHIEQALAGVPQAERCSCSPADKAKQAV
jgi:hypothetical protein